MVDSKLKKVKARSPKYPIIGLREAIEKVTAIYNKDYQNPVQRKVIAGHMGYKGLNGKSLGVLSSLSKYGLLEGRGNESRVSDLAMEIIVGMPGSQERILAIKEASSKPELFKDIDGRYSAGKASDESIRSYLLLNKFIPSAADSAVRSYRETKELLELESATCVQEKVEEDSSVCNPNLTSENQTPIVSNSLEDFLPKIGMRRTIFGLSEGDVTITYPEKLSSESMDDLADYLETFMKRAKREAIKK